MPFYYWSCSLALVNAEQCSSRPNHHSRLAVSICTRHLAWNTVLTVPPCSQWFGHVFRTLSQPLSCAVLSAIDNGIVALYPLLV